MRKEEMLNTLLESTGYHVATWSPGDGATRYAVVPKGHTYHSHDGVARALGFAQALVMAKAFRAGYYAGQAAKK
jgi:hypothetical protein